MSLSKLRLFVSKLDYSRSAAGPCPLKCSCLLLLALQSRKEIKTREIRYQIFRFHSLHPLSRLHFSFDPTKSSRQ